MPANLVFYNYSFYFDVEIPNMSTAVTLNFRYLTILLCSCLPIFNSFSQGTFIPFDPEINHMIDRMDIRYGKVLTVPHTSSKPFLRADAARMAEALQLSNIKVGKRTASEIKYLMDDNAEWLDTLKSATKNPIWLFRRGSKVAMYREPASLAKVDIKNFNLRLNPILAFRFGAESASKGLRLVNTRGVDLRFNIKNVVSGYFMFTENQTLTPSYAQSRYLRDSLNTIEAVPGETYWKEYNSNVFKIKDGVDYFQARGYVNINALNYFNITFGHDKNFIGNGYRSMFLSDNSPAYLFLKLNTRVWKINYQNLFCELTNQYRRGGDQLLPKKYAAFHHLNFEIARWLNIGFFEGVIFNRSKNFEFQYLNPLIFYRSIEQAVGSPDNALLGVDFKSNFLDHISLYGQFYLDEFNFGRLISKEKWWGNKYAIQVGMKYIDIVPNLDAQLEFNMARPFMYGHDERATGHANYTHYNQALAHPLGANFSEFIFIARYQPVKRLFLSMKYLYSTYGEDTISRTAGRVTNFGGDIFRSNFGQTTNNATGVISEIGHKHLQGVRAKQHFFSFRASYMFWHNVYADLELLIRNKNSTFKPYSYNSTYFAVGLRMNIPYKEYVF